MFVKTNAAYIFNQLTDLLEHLSDDQYVETLDIFSGASIGKHYRHIIEFFQCVSLANQTNTICYDNRLRDVRIETDRNLAAELLGDLQLSLMEIDGQKELILIGDLDAGNQNKNALMNTSLFREFHYAVEHAIHHMAIIKMGVKQSFASVNIPAEFGVAPSTLRYQSSLKEH